MVSFGLAFNDSDNIYLDLKYNLICSPMSAVGKKRYPLVLDDLVQITFSNSSDSNEIKKESESIEESPDAQWDNETLTCRRALSKISYQISHDGDGSITKVAVSVSATNISSEAKTFQQHYSVSFSLDSDEEKTGERKRSGNPGYVFGLPTLARISTTTSYETESQMKIMGLGNGGKCNDVSNSMVSLCNHSHCQLFPHARPINYISLHRLLDSEKISWLVALFLLQK